MRNLLKLAILAVALTTSAAAQFHIPQLSHKAKETREDLSWLAPFAIPAPDGRENDLVRDPRFKAFLRTHLTAPQTFWNENQPLLETIMEFLGVPHQAVLDDNRFFSADGCVPHFCPARGLFFADLGAAHPLVVFVAIDWTKENKTPSQSGAEYTLWLFANRALRTGDPGANETAAEQSSRIPAALKRSLARWTGQPSSGSQTLQNITTAILVDPDGTPHQVAPSLLGITQAKGVSTASPTTQGTKPASHASTPTQPAAPDTKK